MGYSIDGLERRRKRRFSIRQPAILRIHDDSRKREVHGITHDASDLGALVIIDSLIPVGARVDLRLILARADIPTLQLVCPGKVVRVEQCTAGNGIAVAVECERPFSGRQPKQNIPNV